MPATINGTSGFGGNLTGNVTGNADTATTATGLVNSSGSAPVYGCRAWVHFDGTRDSTGSVSSSNTNRLIRSSGNVSSVLRNGTGDYTISFTTAMQDANYCAVFGCAHDDTAPNADVGAAGPKPANSGSSPFTTSTLRVVSTSTSSNLSYVDAEYVSVAIFR